ncbi:MAG TPA: hypothetical protein VIY47_09315 [Ignavibacteriaceae bacterium]
MKKEKIFIILSHKHSLKTKHAKSENPDNWQVTETVEFVNQIRDRHISMSSAIGDYINRKMISGASRGITDYDKFEEYIRSKYAKELAELDAAYKGDQIPKVAESTEVYSDQFGNIRAKTVFDPV